MKVIGHQLWGNEVSFNFTGYYHLVITGRRAFNTDLVALHEVSLHKGAKKVASYKPECINPKLRLAEGLAKKTFFSYWAAAVDYFKKNITTIHNPARIKEKDLRLLLQACEEGQEPARDGRKTKVIFF